MNKDELYRIYEESTRTMKIRDEARVAGPNTPTFMEFPRAYEPHDLSGANMVFLGFPHEGFRSLSPVADRPPGGEDSDPNSIYFRTGTYEAPRSVRQWSVHQSIRHFGGNGYLVEYDLDLLDYLKVVDYGDVDCVPGDVGGDIEKGIQRVREIVAAGAIPLVQGGTHSTPIPAVLGMAAETKGQIGIIAFDSHFDLSGGKSDLPDRSRFRASSQYMRMLETPNVEPENIVMIGLRGIRNPKEWANVARNMGITYFTLRDVDELGIDQVVAKALERVQGTDHLYVTLDVDVVDAGICRAQAYPDTPGLTPREVVGALRQIGKSRVINGFDISCLCPKYDPGGGSTQLFATRCYLEVMGSVAQQFKNLGIKKWQW